MLYIWRTERQEVTIAWNPKTFKICYAVKEEIASELLKDDKWENNKQRMEEYLQQQECNDILPYYSWLIEY